MHNGHNSEFIKAEGYAQRSQAIGNPLDRCGKLSIQIPAQEAIELEPFPVDHKNEIPHTNKLEILIKGCTLLMAR